jgi:NAD(P)-dependent dehydrogenase (short-subunit alcohol dehydrogenase family)
VNDPRPGLPSGSIFDLSGQVAIVTGAARGLGRAIALGLARHGADLVLFDRDMATLENSAAESRGLGRRVDCLECDLAREESITRAVDAVYERLPAIDILVNNAGITRRKALVDWEAADWEELIRINQIGTFVLSRAVGLRMVARRTGSIINISALGGGLVGLGRGNAIYCSTKAAVAAITRDLAAEWAGAGVRVNALAPGWFATEMNRPLIENAEVRARILSRVPLNRLGEPEDLVGPVVFLASRASAMITGCLLPVDGGAHAIIKISEEPVIQ